MSNDRTKNAVDLGNSLYNSMKALDAGGKFGPAQDAKSKRPGRMLRLLQRHTEGF